MTTSNDIEVALRSSRTRTTVPSRISRTIGSSASERPFQASQSAFTLRHTRLTADRTAEQRRECSADPARVGAGEVCTCNQRIGGQRAAKARSVLLFHSVVWPSGPSSRARGTAISVRPKVPISERERWHAGGR